MCKDLSRDLLNEHAQRCDSCCNFPVVDLFQVKQLNLLSGEHRRSELSKINVSNLVFNLRSECK